jgi:ABC-type branched-subunit amino acid transport system substrate-binding protein
MRLPRIAYIGIAGICLFIAIKIGSPPSQPLQPNNTATSICEAAQTIDRVSCGSKIILVPPGGGRNRRNKIDGFAAIKNKDYQRGIDLLQQDWNTNHDPETLIAIQNAQILRDRPQQVKTIAVVIPSQGAPEYVAESILKGLAEAQREWNQSNRGWKLLVAIADDRNEPAEAKQIAEELTKHQDVLAILGHYSSNVSVSVKDIYNRAKTVLVSATSTTDELTSEKDDPNNYFFRVTNTTKTSGEHLAQKWLAKPDKIVLFYTPGKKFSEAFRKAFVAKIPPGTIVKEFHLSDRTNAAQELAIAKAAGAKTIVVIPDAYTDYYERDRVLSIVKANQGQMPILATSIMRDAYLFQVNPSYLKNLVISIPVHPTDRQFIDAAKLSQAPDWWGVKSQIHDRIINSFDAAQVILAALDRSTDRESVRQTIASPSFSASGITGSITFSGSDRAKKIDSLVTPTTCGDKNCNFELAH